MGWGASRIVCVVASLLLAVGCGDSNMGTVTGTVKVDGELPESGSIAFFPVDRKSPTTGTSIVNGAYEAKVPIGLSQVQIRVSKKVGEQKLYDTPDSPIQPVLAEVLPPKYNDQTELQIDVKPGENKQDYELDGIKTKKSR